MATVEDNAPCDGFGTAGLSLRGGTKGVCRHVNTLTFKSVMELRKSV